MLVLQRELAGTRMPDTLLQTTIAGSLPKPEWLAGPLFSLWRAQWILAAAGHSKRHTEQIIEVKADPNFPAK